ncbi:TonB-dependent receptor family protein [Muriicola sp. Z0-33]|uniref:TonB-dependent receptor family protein n=1 Tax=Muriicola sp. Z0-33 TaxID=2816957 RepID=UPI00223744B0|nr:TonB-dependent receptor [Muriicola sp. Z0-33]MCW5514932.1 TonB-dependent receptor [Muriicola sp. Z0-33]
MKTSLFCILLVISFSNLLGQESVQDSVTYLDEVILVDPVKNKAAKGITASNVIKGKIFQNQSPIDFAATINQIAGVHMFSGALNTNRITIRGVGARTPFGTDKIRLYYNDIPVTNGTGFSTIEAFDLENLNAIEIIKGPKSAAYGTNLGGAMLLRTTEVETTGTTVSNNFTAGSYGLIKNNLSLSHADEKLNFNMHYGHMSTDGYRENNSFDRDGLLLNLSRIINSKSTVSLLVNYIDYTAQIPSSLSQTAFDEDPTQAAFTWNASQGFEANKYTLVGLSHTYKFNEKFRNTTGLFYSYLDHYEPRPFNILDEYTNGYGFRSNFSGNFDLNGQEATYNFGGEFYRDEYKWQTFENLYRDNNGNGSLEGDQISNNKEYRRQFNGFGVITLPLSSRLKAQAGLNINKTHYDFRDLFTIGAGNKNAKRNFDLLILPSLSMEYGLGGGSRIYANVSRGFSNPSLEETLTPDGLINPEIEQETGTNYELGTKLFFWPKTNLWLDITFYRMDIKNLLVAQRVGEDQFIGKNAGKTRHQGIELQLDYRFNLGNNTTLSPSVGYTVNDHSFKEFVDGDDDFSGNPLTGVPKHRLHFSSRLEHKKKFYWTATYQYVDDIPLTDANSLSSDAYGIFSSQMGYNTSVSEKLSLGINIGVNNIFDTTYARSVLINAVGFGGNAPRYFYPGNDRNYYGGVQLAYRL